MSAADLMERLERYLALRRALGFPMRAQERLLRDFVEYVSRSEPVGPIRSELAVQWACSTAGRCGSGGQASRLTLVRGFLTYLRALDQETEVPPHHLLPGATRPLPHIYSPQELAALLAAAQQLGPQDSLRPHTTATLIGLVASCGLRIREALGLQLQDVDLDSHPPVLQIRQTKFRKSRWVPLHPSTAERLRAYAQLRRQLGYDGLCDFFFVSERAGPLAYHTIAATFVDLARRLGIRGPKGQRGAHLHDLRHTFAVTRLLHWYQEGADVRARLPELSVYLGHVQPQQTYWYLSATPALLQIAASRFETFVANVHAPAHRDQPFRRIVISHSGPS